MPTFDFPVRLSAPPVSIMDHLIPQEELYEQMVNVYLLQLLANSLNSSLRQWTCHNELMASAGLHRAAALARQAFESAESLARAAPEELQYTLETQADRYLDTLEDIVSNYLARDPFESGTDAPTLPPDSDDATEPRPSSYWRWAQVVAQCHALAEIMPDLLVQTDNPIAKLQFSDHVYQNCALGAAIHAIANFTRQLDQLPEQPDDFDQYHHRQTSAQIIADARAALTAAAQTIATPLADFHQSAELHIAPGLEQHDDVIKLITETPVNPGTIRTAVIFEHPAGPVTIVAHNTATGLHVRRLHDPTDAYTSDLSVPHIATALFGHFQADHQAGNLAPRTLIIEARHYYAAQDNEYDDVTPSGFQHIAQTFRQRKLGDSTVRAFLHLLCQRNTHAHSVIAAMAGISPEWCAEADLAQLHQVIHDYNHDTAAMQQLAALLGHDPDGAPNASETAASHVRIVAKTAGATPDQIAQIDRICQGTGWAIPQHTPAKADLFQEPAPDNEVTTCPCLACNEDLAIPTIYPDSRHRMIALTALAHASAALAADPRVIALSLPKRRREQYQAVYHRSRQQQLEHFIALNPPHPRNIHNRHLSAVHRQYQNFVELCNQRDPALSGNQHAELYLDSEFQLVAAVLDTQRYHHAIKFHEQQGFDANTLPADVFHHASHAAALAILANSTTDMIQRDRPEYSGIAELQAAQAVSQQVVEDLNEHYLATTPLDISEAAAQYRNTFEQVVSAPVHTTPLDIFPMADPDNTEFIDIVVRNHYQGRQLIRKIAEPFPPGYSGFHIVINVHGLLATPDPPLPYNPDLERALADLTAAVQRQAHDRPLEHWQPVVDAAQRHQLSPATLHLIMHALTGLSIASLNEFIPPFLDPELQRQLVQRARDLNFDSYTMRQLQPIIDELPDHILPPPLPKRHRRAIARAATQAGIPTGIVNDILDDL